jgi:hypothetical protein
MIANAVSSVAQMLVVMAAGFIIAGSKFYRENLAEQALNKYLSAVAIPIYLFTMCCRRFRPAPSCSVRCRAGCADLGDSRAISDRFCIMQGLARAGGTAGRIC